MSLAVKKFLSLALLVLTLAARALAQVNSGEATFNLNGTVSGGYTNDSSNTAGSDHSIFGAGIADFSGSYHNPNFLSFDVQPFYNQSRLNSSYQSMTAASGVNAGAKIFGGSQFPGSISYTDTFNSSGNFGVPGLANYTTHGDTDVLAVNWGIFLENLPKLNLSFADADSNYSVYGANARGTTHSDSFSVTSSYKIAGFSLNGGYQYNGSRTSTPAFLTAQPSEQSDSRSNSFFAGIEHNLPWNGSFAAGASHLSIGSNYGSSSSADNYNTTVDTLTSSLSFAPLTHLTVGGTAYYTDNLEGTLFNTLLTAGITTPESLTQETSRDLSLTGMANYEMPAQHLDFHAFVQRQQETFLGASLASNTYNGQATYSNRLLGGQFSGALGVTGTTTDTSHQSLVGLNTTINYRHAINKWTVSGAFSYSQDTQTLLINETTSGYTYTGSAGRRVGRRSYWNVFASGSRSLLNGDSGTADSNQSYGTSISLARFSLNGSYSKSSGNALLTSTGLVTTPIPVTEVPSTAVVFFNGTSYALGIGSNPIRGLTLSASFAKSLSTTNSNSALSTNNNQYIYALMIYHFRKLDFQAGFSNLVQGFSATGTPPARDNSFYVGIARWFNFF
jgi:hypothetical protein